MAYDEGLAQILREKLGGHSDTLNEALSEKKMFGGLCFMLNGHMLCGVHSKNGDGGMIRVGPAQYSDALAMNGVEEMAFTGRPMKGFVEIKADVFDDDDVLTRLLDMALRFNASLPPK